MGGYQESFFFFLNPLEAQKRLAVVNGPKCSPVNHSLICPLGAREESGVCARGGGVLAAPAP